MVEKIRVSHTQSYEIVTKYVTMKHLLKAQINLRNVLNDPAEITNNIKSNPRGIQIV
jgi:hypothetical protein